MLIITLSLMLGLIIMLLSRAYKPGIADVNFFKITSLIYIMVFSVAPLIYFSGIYINSEYVGYSYLYHHRVDRIYLFYAISVAFLGYLFMFFGYSLSNDFLKSMPVASREIASKYDNKSSSLFMVMLILSCAFAVFGTIAFALYVNSIGSFADVIKYSGYYRSNPIASSFSFMKNLAPFVVMSSYIAFSLLLYKTSLAKKTACTFLFLFTFIVSMTVYYHQAGRLNLIIYVSTFPITYLLIRDKYHKTIAGFLVSIFLIFVILGKELFNYFLEDKSFDAKIGNIGNLDSSLYHSLISEFIFPFMNIANSVEIVPKVEGYRYFSDILLSIGYLLPSSWLERDLPRSVSSINSDYFLTQGTVPVDLVSYGYYSLGVLGVAITMTTFGIILGCFDHILPHTKSPTWATLRVAWLIFLPMRLVYGDPSIILKIGFTLIVCTAVVFVTSYKYYRPEGAGMLNG